MKFDYFSQGFLTSAEKRSSLSIFLTWFKISSVTSSWNIKQFRCHCDYVNNEKININLSNTFQRVLISGVFWPNSNSILHLVYSHELANSFGLTPLNCHDINIKGIREESEDRVQIDGSWGLEGLTPQFPCSFPCDPQPPQPPQPLSSCCVADPPS